VHRMQENKMKDDKGQIFYVEVEVSRFEVWQVYASTKEEAEEIAKNDEKEEVEDTAPEVIDIKVLDVSTAKEWEQI